MSITAPTQEAPSTAGVTRVSTLSQMGKDAGCQVYITASICHTRIVYYNALITIVA